MNNQLANFLTVIVIINLFLISCAPQKNIHGILISDLDIESIVEGETKIDFLINKYGEPSFTGAFNKNVYYKNETTRILPAGKKEFISRKILALKINDEGVIVKKEILNLDDGISIKPTSGKTETAGSDLTILQQIFLNLRSGRFQSTD